MYRAGTESLPKPHPAVLVAATADACFVALRLIGEPRPPNRWALLQHLLAPAEEDVTSLNVDQTIRSAKHLDVVTPSPSHFIELARSWAAKRA